MSCDFSGSRLSSDSPPRVATDGYFELIEQEKTIS